MKNIHILATDNPSRFYFNTKAKCYAFSYEVLSQGGWVKNKHIYITSPDEEIKDGDYYITILDNEVFKANVNTVKIMNDANKFSHTTYKNTHFKIILTTDPKLILYDVQSIPDEFLEWFVKNPSCEEVEVKMNQGRYFDYGGNVHITNAYKIIIPKEEPNIIDQWLEKNGNPEIAKQVEQEAEELCKQEQKKLLIEIMQEDEDLGLYAEPKQETVEEAAEKKYGLNDKYSKNRLGFIEGAKWQQEQEKKLYSEEEVFRIVASILHTPTLRDGSWEDIAEWFEKFKKK